MIFIFVILFTCILQTIIIVSFGRHIPCIYNSYTAYLRKLYKFAEKMRFIYMQFLVNFLYGFFGVIVDSDLMTHFLPSLLSLTVSNGRYKKTVTAFIDSGSYKSFIKPELAKELKLISTVTETGEFTVQVTEPNRIRRNKQPKNELILMCKSLSDFHMATLPDFFTEEIEQLLNITLHPVEEEDISLLIGADQMTSLLMPPSLPFPKCFSIASNISAIETPFGYYLQGFQCNYNTYGLLRNWYQFSMYSFEDWKYVLVCLAFDWILTFVLDF